METADFFPEGRETDRARLASLIWSLSASTLSRTCVEAARLGGVPADCHVAPTPAAGFRVVNEDPRTVRPLTNAQSIRWQRQDLLDHPIGDRRCDQVEVECIVAEVDEHTPIAEAQLMGFYASDPMLAKKGQGAFRRRMARNDPGDQLKQGFAQNLCARQRDCSCRGVLLRLLSQCAQHPFWQEMHKCRPFKQTWVAVKPVARRLIAASDGIDEIERWIAADDVTLAKLVRLNSNL